MRTEKVREAGPATLWERIVYWGLVSLLFLAPLPLGSVSPWAVSLIVMWVAALGAIWVLGWVAGQCPVGTQFYLGYKALGLLALWAMLLTLQITPIPSGLAAWLSPGANAAHAGVTQYGSADPAGWGHFITLSLDAAATRGQHLLTLALTGYFALLCLVIVRTSRLKHFVLMMVTSGIVYAVLALYAHFTGANYLLFHEEVAHTVAKGPFSNRNHFSAYLEICLACGAGLIVADFTPAQLTTGNQRLRWVLGLLLSAKARMRLMLIVMVIALILTRSRMGNAAFFTALIAGGFVALVFLRARWKTLLLFFGSMIILDLVVIGSWIGVEQVLKRMQDTALTVETKRVESLQADSIEDRTGPGISALASARTFPWFGTGAGTFAAIYPQHKQPYFANTIHHAFNDYIEFFVESGGLGAFLLFTLLLSAYVAVLRTLRHSTHVVRRGLALGAFIGMLSLTIHALVEYAFQIPAVALQFTALLAVAFLSQDRVRDAREDPATP